MKKLRQCIVMILRFPMLRELSVALLSAIVFLTVPRTRGPMFTVMQVGGRGGADPFTKWLRFRGRVKTIGVEPESTGLTKMQTTKAYDYIVPHAFGDKVSSAPLYITKARGWCSLLKPDEAAIKRVVTTLCWDTRPFDVVSRETINTTTLDAVRSRLPDIHYLQIDVQGAELAVLRGASATLRSIAVVELEVRFYPIYENERTFSDISAYLEQQGFLLFQMTRQGELEFGSLYVEANACYVNTRMQREQPDLVATLQSYADTKHRQYGNSFLRLLCDIAPTKALTTTLMDTL